VSVTWTDGLTSCITFRGQGSTAEERRGSMHQQLAALRSSAQFLAPESWPASSCVVAFHLCDRSPEHAAALLDAAVRTTSLLNLLVQGYDMANSAPWRAWPACRTSRTWA
jgi:hypothetical protein